MPDWLLWAWLVFASQHSGYPSPPGEMPTVAYAMLAPDRGAQTDQTDPNHRIVFSTRRAVDQAETACELAHEATHWLQFKNHIRFACIEDMEPMAYKVTAACFHALGQPHREAWAMQQAAAHGCARTAAP